VPRPLFSATKSKAPRLNVLLRCTESDPNQLSAGRHDPVTLPFAFGIREVSKWRALHPYNLICLVRHDVHGFSLGHASDNRVLPDVGIPVPDAGVCSLDDGDTPSNSRVGCRQRGKARAFIEARGRSEGSCNH
jgi:hypothetical protein